MPADDGQPSTAPGQGAWLSAVLRNTGITRGFRTGPAAGESEPDWLRRLSDRAKRMQRGEAFAANEIEPVWRHHHKWAFDESLLPVMILGSWIGLRRDVAEVFEGFDLGRGRLHPVELVEHDGATPISRDYAVLSPGNAAAAFDLERSTGIVSIRYYNELHLFVEMRPARDRPVYVLKPGFASVPDVWVDPRVTNSLFFSERLVAALKAAKFDKPFALSRCEPF